MSDVIQDAIKANATGPQSVSVDGNTVTQHPLPAQIEADRYVKSQEAKARKGFGLRFQKIVPPGAG